MMRRVYLVWLVLAIMLVTLPVCAQGPEQTTTKAPTVSGKKVSLALNNVPLKEAVDVVAKAGELAYAFSGDLPSDIRVTLNIPSPGIDAFAALQMICQAAGLVCRPMPDVPNGVIIYSSPWGRSFSQTAGTSGTGTIPMPISDITAVARAAYERVKAGSAAGAAGVSGSVGAGPGAIMRPPLPSFSGDKKLVDLEVKDAPLNEALRQLAMSSGYAIILDESAPQGIKVTAKVYKMPFGEVLSTLMSQAGLIYTVEYRDPNEKERHGAGVAVIHIVPVPELKVTVP